LAAVALLLAGCSATGGYFAATDAPKSVADGNIDARLALTRAVGGPLSPIVRNMAAPYGQLRFADGLEAHLRRTLRPLDIVLVRSRPAATRNLIPSYFTHSLVWLGTPEEMRANGGLQVAGKHAKAILAGKTVFEAAGDEVRLSEIGEILNTDEIVILRPQALGRKRSLGKYRGLLSKVGMPFDYNFDFLDKSRLTCMETVAEIFPEFGVPVRYTAGRYAVIPDDLVRRAIAPGSGLTAVEHIQPDPRTSYAIRSPSAVAKLLSQPQAKPRLATIY
jgi:hypothetical protein